MSKNRIYEELVIKQTAAGMYHLVDPETDRSVCCRDASGWFSMFASEYRPDWEQYRTCSRCGGKEHFRRASDRATDAYLAEEEKRLTSQAEARELATDKAAVLKDQVWPLVKQALRDAGFTVEEAEPRGQFDRGGLLRVSTDVGGHRFRFKIEPPLTAYGVWQHPPYEIRESQPGWVEELNNDDYDGN